MHLYSLCQTWSRGWGGGGSSCGCQPFCCILACGTTVHNRPPSCNPSFATPHNPQQPLGLSCSCRTDQAPPPPQKPMLRVHIGPIPYLPDDDEPQSLFSTARGAPAGRACDSHGVKASLLLATRPRTATCDSKVAHLSRERCEQGPAAESQRRRSATDCRVRPATPPPPGGWKSAARN